MKATLVKSKNWMGLYIDGDLKSQNSKIPLVDVEQVVEAHCDVDVEHVNADENWASTVGYFPSSLADVKLS